MSRVVTCVSRTFDWPKENAPKILLFDNKGRSKQHDMIATRTDKGWQAPVTLNDWQEIAVLEE